jgi:hypothetical protein
MYAKRNKALLFLGLLVVTLLLLFGHVFPVLEAFRHKQEKHPGSWEESPGIMLLAENRPS